MVFANVPAWAAVAGAAITAAAGLLGTLVGAYWGRQSDRDRLRQERDLDGARDRVRSLERAIASASRIREEAAAALRWFDPSAGHGPEVEGLWCWTSDVQHELKGHESSLKLRFGVGELTASWEFLEFSFSDAVVFCESHKPLPGAYAEVPEDVKSGALDRRGWTREALESFISVAGAVVVQPAQQAK